MIGKIELHGCRGSRAWRLALCCRLALSLALIWTLTAQTPEETSAVTSAAVYAIDDILGSGSFSDGAAAGATTGGSADGSRITGQPGNVTARQGDTVTFSVEADEAVAFLRECTDDGTDGWYTPGVGDPTSSTLSFALSQGEVWRKDCDFRCRVTFDDGAVEYSDVARIEYREMASWGPAARKLAHTVEFLPVGLFAAGLSLSLSCGRGWGRRRVLVAAVVFCLLCSLGDQVHKIFVPGREFDAVDMLFDAAGYGFGIFICIMLFRVQTGPLRLLPDKLGKNLILFTLWSERRGF